MKKRGQVPPSKRIEVLDLPGPYQRRQLAMQSRQGNKKHLLLRHPDFVAKSTDASFEPPPLVCEASALTTELTAPTYVYFSPRVFLCKTRPLNSVVIKAGKAGLETALSHT